LSTTTVVFPLEAQEQPSSTEQGSELFGLTHVNELQLETTVLGTPSNEPEHAVAVTSLQVAPLQHATVWQQHVMRAASSR
jgi:hypothetical protein